MKNTPLISHYPSNTDEHKIAFVVSAFAVVGFPLTLLLLFLFFAGVFGGHPDSLDSNITKFLLMFAVMFFTSLWFMPFFAYWLWKGSEISLHADGIDYKDRQSSRYIPYDSVESISAGRWGGYRLHFKDAPALLLDRRYLGLVSLTAEVLKALRQRRSYEKAWENGEILQTGSLGFSKSGIQIAGKTFLPWATISRFGAINNYTAIEFIAVKSRLRKIKTAKLPDAPLILQFVTERLVAKDVSLANQLSSRWLRREAFMTVLLSLLGLVLSLYSMGTGIYNLSQYPAIPLEAWLSGAIALILPIFCAWHLYLNLRRIFALEEIVVSAEGLRYRTGKTESLWQWDEIDDLRFRNNILINGSRYIGLDIYVDDSLVLRYHSQFYDYLVLVEAIQAHYLKAHYEAIKDSLNRGDSLSFQPLIIDALGLQYKEQSIAWDMMKSVRFASNEIVLTAENGNTLLRLSAFDISHCNIVYQLLRERLTGQAPTALQAVP